MLNYDQRKKAVSQHLAHLLSGYEPPYNLRDDTAKQVREADEICELIVNNLPTWLNENQITGTFERTGKDLKRTAKTRSWPIARDIIEAIHKATPAQDAASPASQPFKFDSDTIAAKRINAGDPVAENYINGIGAERLIEKKLITPQKLQGYKKYLEQEKAKLYGKPQSEPVRHTEHEPDFMENPY